MLLASNVQQLHALPRMGVVSDGLSTQPRMWLGKALRGGRIQSREALRDVRLHLSGALHATLYLTSVAVKRESFGEAANAAKNIALASRQQSEVRRRPREPPCSHQQTLLKQGVNEQDGCVGQANRRENRCRIAGHVVLESHILVLQDLLQNDRLVTAYRHMQYHSAIDRRRAEKRGRATPRPVRWSNEDITEPARGRPQCRASSTCKVGIHV